LPPAVRIVAIGFDINLLDALIVAVSTRTACATALEARRIAATT